MYGKKLGHIKEKACEHSSGHIYSTIFMNFGENNNSKDISAQYAT